MRAVPCLRAAIVICCSHGAASSQRDSVDRFPRLATGGFGRQPNATGFSRFLAKQAACNDGSANGWTRRGVVAKIERRDRQRVSGHSEPTTCERERTYVVELSASVGNSIVIEQELSLILQQSQQVADARDRRHTAEAGA